MAVAFGSGCASTVKQAAREAAPAAAEETVEEVREPETRQDIADILSDPGIGEATTALSDSFVQGMLDGLTEPERMTRLQALTDALVTRAGSALAKSFEAELGPQISATVADAVDKSLERMLDERTEARIQAIVLAASRGAVQGIGDALVDDAGQPSPALQQVFGRVVRDASYHASFGFQHAVHDARQNDALEARSRDGVLGALGRVSEWSRAIPAVIVLGLGLMVLVLTAALIWALVSLRRARRGGSPPELMRPPLRGAHSGHA